MSPAEIIAIVVCAVLSVLCVVISAYSFNEKGYLFNNAYIWASKEKRAELNKKPYYRQSAITFCLVGVIFAIMAFAVVFQNYKIELLEIPLTVSVLIYAIISEIHINKKNK